MRKASRALALFTVIISAILAHSAVSNAPLPALEPKFAQVATPPTFERKSVDEAEQPSLRTILPGSTPCGRGAKRSRGRPGMRRRHPATRDRGHRLMKHQVELMAEADRIN